MKKTGAITLDEIIHALSLLGGEAESKIIKDKVTEIRGGIPSHYGTRHSYRETIQKKIEDHCPQSANYKNTNEAHFEKIRRGYYRLIDYKKAEEKITTQYIEKEPTETEKKAIIDSRIGQGVFREKLIKKWRGCSVTGCNQIDILIASHIKPWAVSNNSERLDVDNGLLLTPNLEALFDKGYITFSKSGVICISSELTENNNVLLGINKNMSLKSLNKNNQEYLNYHREYIFKA